MVEIIELEKNNYHPLYDWNLLPIEKIKIIAQEIYGADDVTYSQKAIAQLKEFDKLGVNGLPICMAKTQKSFSDDEKVGRPTNFKINIREFELANGAGFIVAIVGEMMRMPGLPAVPAAEGMNIDSDGNITGLS